MKTFLTAILFISIVFSVFILNKDFSVKSVNEDAVVDEAKASLVQRDEAGFSNQTYAKGAPTHSSELESDNCFGPFKPMTSKQYPVLFYKITKDFMGTMLWALLGIFVFFIMLYILCLFNPIGRAAYKLNENAGMIEGGMESTGMNMDNIVKMIK